MSIFLDENTKVVYQGLTGSTGRYYGLLNREYGTKVVAGTHPKKAGTDVDGIPILASVADAVAETGSNRRRRRYESRRNLRVARDDPTWCDRDRGDHQHDHPHDEDLTERENLGGEADDPQGQRQHDEGP